MIRKRIFIHQGESLLLRAMVRYQANGDPMTALDDVVLDLVAADGTTVNIDPPMYALYDPPEGSASNPNVHWNTAVDDPDGYCFSIEIPGDELEDSDWYEARITITAGTEVHRLVFEISVREAIPILPPP